MLNVQVNRHPVRVTIVSGLLGGVIAFGSLLAPARANAADVTPPDFLGLQVAHASLTRNAEQTFAYQVADESPIESISLEYSGGDGQGYRYHLTDPTPEDGEFTERLEWAPGIYILSEIRIRDSSGNEFIVFGDLKYSSFEVTQLSTGEQGPNPPSTPMAPRAVTRKAKEVNVSWNSGRDPNRPETRWLVKDLTTGRSYALEYQSPARLGTEVSLTVKGLAPGSHRFSVSASGPGGSSQPSAPSTIVKVVADTEDAYSELATDLIGSSPKVHSNSGLWIGAMATASAGSFNHSRVRSRLWQVDDPGVSHQWFRVLRDGKLQIIPGATGLSYRLTSSDAGLKLIVSITRKSSGATVARGLGAPSATTVVGQLRTRTASHLNGTAKVGATLKIALGAWSAAPDTLDYSWMRDCGRGEAAITGVKGQTYTPAARDVGCRVRALIDPSKFGYMTWPSETNRVLVAPGTLTTAAPSVIGLQKVGNTLTASAPAWKPSPVVVSYQWYRVNSRSTVAIKGANKSTYRVSKADRGSKLKIVITGRKAGYSTAKRSYALTRTVRS